MKKSHSSRRFGILRRDDGNVAIEYALLAAVVGLGMTSALKNMRGGVNQGLGRASGNLLLASIHVDRCDNPSNCQSVGTPYQMGFAVNADSDKILTSGWSFLEGYHVWSTGKDSTVTMDLGNLMNKNGQVAKINLETYSFISSQNLGDMTTHVTINGVDVGNLEYYNGDSWVNKEIKINNDAMIAIAKNNGIAVINLKSSGSGRPVDYGVNSDGRDLGIAIGNITVNPGT